MRDKIAEVRRQYECLRQDVRRMKPHIKYAPTQSRQIDPADFHLLKAEIDALKLQRNELNNKEQEMKPNDNCCADVKQTLDKLIKDKEDEKKEQEKKETAENINDLQKKVDSLLKEKEEEKKKQELKEKDKCCEEIKTTLDQLLKEKEEEKKNQELKEKEEEKKQELKEKDKYCCKAPHNWRSYNWKI